ncbi:MAG TPA: hypothetical protein VMW31_03595, partial [Devosiaceae bacterium]|nr:hypothetical protein [Devosiaceae bacterium]
RWSRADTAPKQACPYLPGGVRWQPPAYDRDTGIAYVGGEDGCQEHMIMPALWTEAEEIDEQGRRAPDSRNDVEKGGLIAALDVSTGEVINSVTTQYPNRSGLLLTAGGLLATATYDGAVRIFDSDTLEELYTFQTGVGLKAPFITYEVNGKQYMAIVAGERQGDYPELGVRGTGVAMVYVFSL